MPNQHPSNKQWSIKELSYPRFLLLVDAYARSLVRSAKRAYPEANDKAFAQETLIATYKDLLLHEPEEGPAKFALEQFDLSYKLGLPLRKTLVTITRQLDHAQQARQTFMPRFTFKRKFKRWYVLPLPWISHIERHDQFGSETISSGNNVRSVRRRRILGKYEGEMMANSTPCTLYRFLVSIYAARKLQADPASPTLLEQSSEEVAQQIKETKPVKSRFGNTKPIA